MGSVRGTEERERDGGGAAAGGVEGLRRDDEANRPAPAVLGSASLVSAITSLSLLIPGKEATCGAVTDAAG